MDPPAPQPVDLSKLELEDNQSEASTDTTSQTAEDKEAAKLAKKAAKAAEKAAKEAAKAARAAQRGQKVEVLTQADPDDPLKDRYGDTDLVQSANVSGRTWTNVSDIKASTAGQKVLLRARVHTVRGKGKSCFLVLRQRMATLQAVLFVDDKTVSKGMVKYATQLSRESIVDVEGVVTTPEAPIESCSQFDVELAVCGIQCVSRAAPIPFEVLDASRSDSDIKALEDKGEKVVQVGQDTRLNDRYLDIRTPANQAIFKVQSAVCQLFREILLSEGFMEIHTPKLISGTSEGGAAVFRIDYMGRPGCLAQSPQLYKQMAICGDFERVFEIGPVFRAEKANTHRHLCEFMGLDLEMAIHEHYDEVLDVINKMFVYIFEGLRNKYGGELSVISGQYPAAPLRWQQNNPRIEFAEGIKWLQEAGYEVDPFGDLNTELERALGKIVKEKYDTDFYILHRYPLAVRPFYTMPCKDDPRYSNSFDIFIRGEEIISGAQRLHDPKLLEERAKVHEIPVESIQSYIDAFKFGAPPHGGCGVGLERVVMLFCGLDNIRKTSLFPRDPKRLTP